MSRTIEISVSPDEADALATALRGLEGVVGLSLQRSASIKPIGDVLTAHTSNEGLEEVLRVLEARGVGRTTGAVVTSEPRSMVASQGQEKLDRETNEMVWQEMDYQLRQETNLSVNYVSLMFLSGALAAGGLWIGSVGVLVGAMAIAPGFEPIIRMPFGLLGTSGSGGRQGLWSSAVGYALVALGAALAVLVLEAIEPSAASLAERPMVQQWSALQWSSALIAVLAGAAGALIISAGRSVLTAGVMIVVALIPAMAIAGMAVAAGDLPLAGRAFLRWSLEALCIAVAGGATFAVKRALIHGGRS